MVRFLAEISQRREVAIHPTPFNRRHGIYCLDISEPPEDSYWLDWGGKYDQYTGTDIEIYYRQFLRKLDSLEDLYDDTGNNAMYIDREIHMVYIKTPLHPWLYPYYGTDVNDLIPFLSAPLNPNKPYHNIIRRMDAKPGLLKPSFNVRLSDGVSGINLNQSFTLRIANNDGYFDDDTLWDLFNTPAYLKKAVKENPQYKDFIPIREGLVDSSTTGFDTVSIEISDRFRTMAQPVCATLGEMYKDIAVGEKAMGKNIPVVYGKKKVKLLDIDENDNYLAAEYVSAIHHACDKDGNYIPCKLSKGIITFNYTLFEGAYDKNGNKLTSTVSDNGIQIQQIGGKYPAVEYIQAYISLSIGEYRLQKIPHRYDSQTGFLKYIKANTAFITGYIENYNDKKNTIGNIVKELIADRGRISYIDSYWNKTETNAYINESPKVNIVFDSGDIKKAVQDVLRSDMAFFIQLMNGKFTIRKWGKQYANHSINPLVISKEPEKQYDTASERYFSSCIIAYENNNDGEKNLTYKYTELEKYAEKKYRKLKTAEFETDLADKNDAVLLAQLLGSRYTTMRQTLVLPVGIDTSEMELLDTVVIPMNINKRKFSDANKFVITGINPAQDILTLEEVENGSDISKP